jgi:hypothetical protein
MEKKFSVEVGGRPLEFSTGRVAKQANGSVVASHGETSILATACITDTPRTGIDFFPLLVDFEERFYSAGERSSAIFATGFPEKGSCAHAVPAVRNAARSITAAIADIVVKLYFQCFVLYVFMYFHPRYFCHILYSTTDKGHRFFYVSQFQHFFLFENRSECASHRAPAASITDRITRTILSPAVAYSALNGSAERRRRA